MFLLLETLREHMYFAVLDCHFCCTVRGETALILELSEGEHLMQVNFLWKPLDVS